MSDRLKFDIKVDVKNLANKNILITGATGLIGSRLALELSTLSDNNDLGIHLVLLVRNLDKLDKNIQGRNIKIHVQDIKNPITYNGKIDYIFHTASITSSNMMIENPVEVIQTNFIGTQNVLEFALKSKVDSMLYFSSMEVYGFTTEETLLTEDNIQYLNPLAIRSSYPESKRMCENLCVAYAKEYDVPVKIIRLAQTFGKGVKPNDTRVFAEFARCVKEKKDIHLLTDGASKRMYLDTFDAVMGSLTVLLNGQNGVAYNCANKDTYCSIADMARFVAKDISNDEITVNFIMNADDVLKFPPSHRFYLDVSRLEKLGWRPTKNLKDMYLEMLEDWE